MSDSPSTRLWREALQARQDDEFAAPREVLRQALKSFRNRACDLAGEIPQELRDLTVHDITHLDALWETADMIVGETVSLTPIEAFVLGGTFLIHDLGLALAAWPDGLSTLKGLAIWKDLAIGLLRRRLGKQPSVEEIARPPDDIAKETLFWVLRHLHAERAESLATLSWKVKENTYHLIELPELRGSLGPLIGRIAHSHSWKIERVRHEFPSQPQGPPAGFPVDWTTDSLKLALLLRVADAAHIDARRAPAFLSAIRQVRGSSANHWTFQGKLNQMRREGDRLLYSGQGFDASEAQAWWLCFDTLRMIDRELREVDNLNADLKRERFAVRGVFAVEDPSRLAEQIPAVGWTPVDARVKVGHVASLVGALGGNQLYGDDQTVPLRELIQNASDAVCARRVLEDLSSDWGDIVVRVGSDSVGSWIEVEDNGVGMSADVLTGAFLDFGRSFWTSPEAATEFPTLLSKGFQSTGKFGIGFFSVFMWADRVHVVTQRYDKARSDTQVLEFAHGLDAPPLLREAAPVECLKGGGTRIRAWPRGVADTSIRWIRTPQSVDVGHFLGPRADPFAVAYWLCPTLEVSLFGQCSRGKRFQLIRAGDWRKISGQQLVERVMGLPAARIPEHWTRVSRHVLPMVEGDTLVGRGYILPSALDGVVTIGGLRSSMTTRVMGFLTGEAVAASRSQARLHVTERTLAHWATDQGRLIPQLLHDLEDQATGACIVLALGGEISDRLPIAKANNRWLTFRDVSKWARKKRSVFVIHGHDERKIQQRYGSSKLRNNVIVEPLVYLSKFEDAFIAAPPSGSSDEDSGIKRYKDARRPVLRAVAEAWLTRPEDLIVGSGEMDIGRSRRVVIHCEELRTPMRRPRLLRGRARRARKSLRRS